ncbi:MAG: DUF427 domain-containing protein [Paracoccaceae bacterium]
MSDRISIRPVEGTWVVRAGGAVLGETEHALELRESDYPPVIYFPRADIGMEFTELSERVSTCPFKGRASYYGIVTKSTLIEDAAWSYEDPKADVAEIAGYLAFFPDKVTIEKV